jgi:hypothetical protein
MDQDHRGMQKERQDGLVLSLAPGVLVLLGEWILWKSWMMEP